MRLATCVWLCLVTRASLDFMWVFFLLLGTAYGLGCSQAGIDGCGMALCQGCELVDGIEKCFGPPMMQNQTCYSPFIEQKVGCIYYKAWWQPGDTADLTGLSSTAYGAEYDYTDWDEFEHARAAIAHCATVASGDECTGLRYSDGDPDVADILGPLGRLDERNLVCNHTANFIPECPTGYVPVSVGDLLGRFLCVVNSTGDARRPNVSPGVGTNLRFFSTNLQNQRFMNEYSSVLVWETGPAPALATCLSSQFPITSGDCIDPNLQIARVDSTGYCPFNRGETCVTKTPFVLPPPVLLASRTVPWDILDRGNSGNIGVCAGEGWCKGANYVAAGPYAAALTANPTNDPCVGTYLRIRIKPFFLQNTTWQLSDKANWPDPTCNPSAPGYPSCFSYTSGYPSLQNISLFTEVYEETRFLSDGARCPFPSRAVEEAYCYQGTCTAFSNNEARCRLEACRRVSEFSGACVGHILPVGTECIAGCTLLGTSKCTATGACVGQVLNGYDFQTRVLGIKLPPNTNCISANCTVIEAGTVAARETFVPAQVPSNGLPYTTDYGDAYIFDVAGVDALSETVLLFPDSNTTCATADLCVTGAKCDGAGNCIPLETKDTYCILTNCSLCSNSTGLCTGAIQPGEACFQGCGEAPQYSGVCGGQGQCFAIQPNATACVASVNDCVDSGCAYTFGGTTPKYSPAFFVTPALLLEDGVTFTRECTYFSKPNGSFCATAFEAGNRCVLSEACNNGVCVVTREINASLVTTSYPCTDPTASFCNPATGQVVLVPLPNGTLCNDFNNCTGTVSPGTPDQCQSFISPVTGLAVGFCRPGTPTPATPVNDPCIQSIICNPLTGRDEVFPKPDGQVCNLISFPGSQCPPTGTCSRGVCVPPESVCPAPLDQCRYAVCNVSGECDTAQRPNGIPCSDGNRCTTGDTCAFGICLGILVSCVPPNECQIEVAPCNFNTGTCTFGPKPTGTSCEGGAGVCVDGLCEIDCRPYGCAECELGVGGAVTCLCSAGENCTVIPDYRGIFKAIQDDVIAPAVIWIVFVIAIMFVAVAILSVFVSVYQGSTKIKVESTCPCPNPAG